MVPMCENGVTLAGNSQARQFRLNLRKPGHLHAGDVIGVSLVIAVAKHSVSSSSDLSGDVPQIRLEPLPLCRNSGGRRRIVAFAEARDQQGSECLEPRRLERSQQCFIHSNRLHQLDLIHAPPRAKHFRRQTELIAKRASESFVRPVARLQREGEDIRRAIRQCACGFRQTASPHVASERAPDCQTKQP